MNHRRIFATALGISCIVLIFLGGLFLGSKHFLMDAYQEELELSQDEVPEDVQAEVRRRHPDASDLIWELDQKRYEVEFFVNGRKVEVYIDIDEGWVKTERAVSFESLPEKVQQLILQEAGVTYEIGNVEAVEIKGSPVVWEVELQNRFYEWDYQFDKSGSLISKERDG